MTLLSKRGDDDQDMKIWPTSFFLRRRSRHHHSSQLTDTDHDSRSRTEASIYPKPSQEEISHPSKGSVDAVATHVSLDEKIKVVNYARKWTEHNIVLRQPRIIQIAVAEWYDVTPITLAAMRGHDSIVEYLLQQGADPTLKGCSLDDINVELSNDENLTAGRSYRSCI